MTATDDFPNAARRVIRGAATAVLSTLDRETGSPYGSLVLVANLHDATPIILISTLAEHTRNAVANPAASILFDGTAGLAEPLTGPRVTVVGQLERTDDATARARFLARHPGAAGYADFADFGFWQLIVSRAHLVQGFGKIAWVDGADVIFETAKAGDLAAREADIIRHMNADHAETLKLYVAQSIGREATGVNGWEMTGIDPEGFDLRRGAVRCRIDFDRPVNNAEAARTALVSMAQQARNAE